MQFGFRFQILRFTTSVRFSTKTLAYLAYKAYKAFKAFMAFAFHAWKRVQLKRKHREKDCQKAKDRDRLESLRMLRYRSLRSFIPLPNVLRQRRQESFEHDLSPFLWWNFLRFSWPLNIFVHNTVFKSWNLGFLATAPVIFIGLLRLKKWSTEKKTPQERLPKGDRSRQIRKFTPAQI